VIAGRRTSAPAQLFDLTVIIASAVLIGSLFMTWYQFGMSFPTSSGTFAGISITALGGLAGGWRFAILAFAIATIVEVALSLGLTRASGNVEWPHRTLLAMLCLVDLVLVLAAFFTYPGALGPAGAVYYGLIGTSRGGGAYLGLVAALVACGAAGARLLSEPSTFRR